MRKTRMALGLAVLMIALALLAPTASATSTLFFEDWEGDVTGTIGTSYCTLNPTTSWTCYSSINSNEARTASVCGAGHGVETNCLMVVAENDFLGSTAPSMGNSWTAPTGDSTVFAEFNLANAQDASSGDFAIFRLTDGNGNEVLKLSFTDANDKLEVTNNSQTSKLEEINYNSPNAFRKYQVDIHPSTGKYDLTISTIGGTTEYSKTDIPYLSTSNGKPALLRLGSLSTNDGSVQGFWDWIKVTG